MLHREEIETIVAKVTPWPLEDRVALAYEILRNMRTKTREADPRNTLNRALGVAKGSTPPPDDQTVERWVAEHRAEKYG